MIVYNITMKVEWSIAEDWLKWMQEVYITGVLATGYFEKHQFVRLLDVDETDGPTYAVQYYSPSLDEYDKFVKQNAPAFSETLHKQWGDKCIAFGTLMQLIT